MNKDLFSLFNVIGLYDLEGTVFARCTTYEKAQRAKELLEAEGFEGMLDIEQDALQLDTVKIDGGLIRILISKRFDN